MLLFYDYSALFAASLFARQLPEVAVRPPRKNKINKNDC